MCEFQAVEEFYDPLDKPSYRDTILSPDGSAARLWRVLDVPSEAVEWMWPDKMPVGKISLIAGDPGRGKSLICVDLASRVSTGGTWPAGVPNLHGPRQVLIVSAEDDVADTIRPRLEAAGADLARVVTMASLLTLKGRVGFEMPRDFGALDAVLDKLPELGLLVIDPIMAFVSPGSTTNQGIRGVIAALQAVATKRRFAVLCITHLTKSPAASPLYRAMGSLGLVAGARAVHTCWPDQDTPGRTLFIPLKSNLSPALNALAYSIGVKEGSQAPAVLWEDTVIPLALISTSTADPVPRIEDARCIDWLRGVLESGPVVVHTLERAARASGFTRNVLRRAKKALRVTTAPVEAGGEWEASLPK